MRKKIHMNVCQITNRYGDRAVWFYRRN